ncbi:hypothetical protein FB192DRAFT_1384318 [Mucor lusitanicus]|uniref:Uncharacterized protein n=1 Tax=Mucor circinelloides f. lusitanicus TaxID=29924 RepID=A0A8H4BFE9_MUCCL|nr:hypothetical protein FB192DRAFT_1384318 [Mucor lusitanicus]
MISSLLVRPLLLLIHLIPLQLMLPLLHFTRMAYIAHIVLGIPLIEKRHMAKRLAAIAVYCLLCCIWVHSSTYTTRTTGACVIATCTGGIAVCLLHMSKSRRAACHQCLLECLLVVEYLRLLWLLP